MLARQVEEWQQYSERAKAMIDFIVVDDASPVPATVPEWIRLYRIKEDIPWGRSGARNLGTHVAETEWIVHLDADHILPVSSAEALLDVSVKSDCWYRFSRYRVGKADETRRKDELDDSCEFGKIRPHIRSHLMTRELFMRSPYDEAYAGCLGGGSPFLARLQDIAPVQLLPEDVHLHVYTRHVIADASIFTLDRDTSEYKRRRREKERTNDTTPKDILQFEWSRIQ